MRIRKNAKKLSPLLFSSMESVVSEVLQTHVCRLNQSPWDVIPLEPHATNQLEEPEDSFYDNASYGDSIGAAVESVASMMEESAILSNNNIVITNQNEVIMADKDGDYCEDLDENGDGSRWKCRKQFKEEDYCSFSYDHRYRPTLLRCSENSYYSTPASICSIAKKSTAGGTASRRTRPAAVGGSNPYEFYYYSGFGPLWGKKRRERGGEESGRSSDNTTGIRSNSMSPSEIDGEELNDEEEEDGGGKKRMRKPVKARSLKSLM